MKKKLIMLAVLLFALSASAQTKTDAKVIEDSIIMHVESIDSTLLWNADITRNLIINDYYKLYPTENIYTFLRLDTSTGQIMQVQWSLDDDKEGAVPINQIDFSLGNGIPGTYELYPTKNMYQFLLLNKRNGNIWHIQWGMEDGKRWCQRIFIY